MKKHFFASVLSLCILITLLPSPALAFDETTVTDTITDIDDNVWTVTTSEDEAIITMTQGENSMTATLGEDGTLTISGSGGMPNLNHSTNMENIAAGNGTYPWAKWRDSVTSIVIGSGITSVGAKSFIGWPNVTSVQIGKDVETINTGAFAQLLGCTAFTVADGNSSFAAEDGVLYSKDKTVLYYYPCAKEEASFTVPSSVTLIGYNAIAKNPNLESITVADGSDDLTLGFGSMFGNESLKSVELPARVAVVGDSAFNADNDLQYISCGSKAVKEMVQEVLTVHAAVILEDGGLFTDDNGYTFAYDSDGAVSTGYQGNETELTIPSEITVESTTYPVAAIHNYAFAETATRGQSPTRRITKVTIPASVKTIGAYAFCGFGDGYGRSNILTDVVIQSDEVALGKFAFARNNALTIDMTAVTSLTAEFNAIGSDNQKVEINAENQQAVRNALADGEAINGSSVKVYLGNSSEEETANYYTYDKDSKTWSASYSDMDVTQNGLTYHLQYENGTFTAEITKYENRDNATELTIPAEITFDTFDGESHTATVTKITGLRGYIAENDHIHNGIKKLTIEANGITLGTTFAYWDDLEEVVITGSIDSYISGVYSEKLEKMTFGMDHLKIFSNGPVAKNPVTMLDLSQVQDVTLGYSDGWGDARPTFYQNILNSDVVTAVYVSSETVYNTINTGTGSEAKPNIVQSGFNFTDDRYGKNIVYIVNDGTVDTTKTGFEAVSRTGYIVTWHEYTEGNVAEEPIPSNTVPVPGKTYYAEWTACEHPNMQYSVNGTVITQSCAACGHSATAALTAPADLIYSGQAKAAAVETTVGWTGNANITYATQGEENFTADAPVNAGSYTAKLAAGEGESAVEITVGFTIEKAQPAVSISAGNGSLTGGGAVKLTVDKSGLPEGAEISVTCGDPSYAPALGTDGSYTVTLPNSDGTYKFTVRYAGDGNHAAATADCTVTVTRYTSGGSSSGSSGGSSSGSATYAVSVDSSKNGTVTVSPRNASRGTTVTITVKPSSGYELDDLTVTDKNGKSVKVAGGKNGKYTFTMPASKVNVEASFTKIEDAPEHSFVDVSDSYWAADAIAWAYENGYMNGNTASTFNPEGTVTRQQLWMILARLSGQRPADFAEAKSWAVDSQITDGTIPGGAVTRQQLVTILYRYAAMMGYKTSGTADLTQFPDHAAVAAYATDAMSWSVANSIVGGTAQGTLNPNGTATRAQFATILMRFCENIVK